MTEIAFHFNVTDKLDYTCRLLRKASRVGSRVAVVGHASQLNQLDTALWTFSSLDFVPHCQHSANTQLNEMSPVVLAESTQSLAHLKVLLNWGDQIPQGYDQFERVIEIVTLDEQDRSQARQRWKAYAQSGHQITRHECA